MQRQACQLKYYASLGQEPYQPEAGNSHDSRQAQEGQRHCCAGTERNEEQSGGGVLPGDAGVQALQLGGHIVQQVLQRQGHAQQLVVLAPQ